MDLKKAISGRPYGESRDTFWRGPARLRGKTISVDRTRLESWRPSLVADRVTAGHPLVELANVTDARQAVAFAEQFGLLHPLPADERIAWEQPLDSLLVDATLLHTIADLYVAVYAAMTELRDGEPGAMRMLRQDWSHSVEGMFEKRFGPSQSDEDFLLRAAGAVADLVSNGTRTVVERISSAVQDGIPVAFIADPHTPDLIGLCYYQLALLMTESVPLRRCQLVGCGRFFAPRTGRGKRQLYCMPEHGNLARVRRHRKEGNR